MSTNKTQTAAEVELAEVTAEMRARKVNNGKHTSPTLEAWADRVDAAVAKLIAERDALAKRIAELEAAIDRIASQGPHFGPDGTMATWKHWADIAREARAEAKP